MYEKAEGLRKRFEDVKNELEGLKKSCEDSWENFKSEIENARDDLKTGIESTISRFK